MITRSKARTLRAMMEKAAISLSDGDALDAPELYPAWESGRAYAAGDRLRDGDKLYRVLQDHTSQDDWRPAAAPALYAEVERPGQGDTPENPIPYDGNMALVAGKYYAQDGVTYRCTRDTGIPVYNRLAELVGLYVEVAA